MVVGGARDARSRQHRPGVRYLPPHEIVPDARDITSTTSAAVPRDCSPSDVPKG